MTFTKASIPAAASRISAACGRPEGVFIPKIYAKKFVPFKNQNIKLQKEEIIQYYI